MTPASCLLTSVSLGVSCELTSDHSGPGLGSQVLAGTFPLSGFSASPGLHVLSWHTPGTLPGTFLPA